MADPSKPRGANSVIHRARIVASTALLGAVVGGALFGTAPVIMGIIGVHEIGALIGGTIGFVANAKHLI
jgi:hypothetical protein